MCPVSQDIIQTGIHNLDDSISCMQFHPGIDCNEKMIFQFIAGSKSLAKMYLIVHLVPFLLFKRKKVKQEPRKQISKLIIAFIKSMLFAGGYSALVRRFICFYTTVYKSQGVSCLFAAIISSLTLNFQPVSRQSEIALFCLNKTIQTTYTMAVRRKYPVRVVYGEAILTGISLSILCYHYFNNKQAIRQNYLKMMDKLIENS